MTIRNLKATGKEYTRRERGGFGIRVLPSGHKVFFYLYRIDGVRRFLKLGEYKDKRHPNGITLEEARRAFTIEQGKITALKAGRSEGIDPVRAKLDAAEKRTNDDEERRKSLTVEKLVTEYIEKHAKKFKRSWQEDERILHKGGCNRNWRISNSRPQLRSVLRYTLYLKCCGKVRNAEIFLKSRVT